MTFPKLPRPFPGHSLISMTYPLPFPDREGRLFKKTFEVYLLEKSNILISMLESKKCKTW
jgi:hypothetical protein